jgi:hypothetical protein
MNQNMSIRTATIIVQNVTAKQEIQELNGTCFVIDKEDSGYYHWHIKNEDHLFADRGGSCVYKTTITREERFAQAIQHALTSIKRYKQRENTRFQPISWQWIDYANSTEVLDNILATLAHIKKRPFMHVYPNAEAAINFLHGFNAGCSTAGYRISHTPETPYQAIIEARGWPFYAGRPITEMRNAGMTEEQIIQELVEIEILTWKATYFLE